MSHSGARRFLAIIGAGILVGVACAPAPAATQAPTAAGSAAPSAATVEQPSRPVEFVISTAPGGGSDIYARAMQGIIEKNKFSPQPVQPLNKEGGSGAGAFTYVFEKKGDMHYVMITLNSFFTPFITQNLPSQATHFTPLSHIELQPFFL